jgi:hypothetical protein
MYGVLEFLIGSLIPKPMPWLLVQLGVLAVWLIGGALAVKKWKTRGLWVLASLSRSPGRAACCGASARSDKFKLRHHRQPIRTNAY